MQKLIQTKKTGKYAGGFAALWVALACLSGNARGDASDPVQFSAQVDRAEISQDDSVSLKLSVQIEGNLSIEDLRFNAPDFDTVNEYSGTYVESYYDNGRFGLKNTRQITKVLRPRKEGPFKISGIQVKVNGKTYSAPDLAVHVGPPGAGTPPPQGYGGGGNGLRGMSKRSNAPEVVLRAEIDKSKVYKGEQMVVSYYLYRRVRVFNIQVDKFPVLNAFLREDLDMPVLGQRLDTEQVVLDGVPYERSLLTRYAAYPLQEGKLKIDSMALKYNYYANQGQGGGMGGLDDEDPFTHFFQQMAPRAGTAKSDQVTVDVEPLPIAGKPNSFSGGVGDFSVSSAVDKYDVHANEALTLTVKIEGRGNIAAVGEPKAKWPDDVELYDSKGNAKAGKGGVGEKDFEFLLIPRVPGKLTLPALEFSFFDPAKNQYVTRSTEPLSINVLDPAPGSTLVAPHKPAQPQSSAPAAREADVQAPKYLKPPGDAADTTGIFGPASDVWRWLYRLCLLAFGTFLLIVGKDLVTRGRASVKANQESRSRAQLKSWDRLRAQAKAAAQGAAWLDVLQGYELLTGAVFDSLDRAYRVGARALPRSELHERLVVAQKMDAALWARVSALLEYAESVRYAGGGAVSEASARKDLDKWVREGESLSRVLK